MIKREILTMMLMSYIKRYQNMDILKEQVSRAIIVKILKRYGELNKKKNKIYRERNM